MTTLVKHVLIPDHVEMAAGSLLNITGKGGVSMASNYAVALQEMVSARTAAHCSTIDIDEVKTEKRLAVHIT